MMDYLNVLENAESKGVIFLCEYCGCETISTSEKAMCSNCECVVATTKAVLERKDSALCGDLAQIRSSIDNKDYKAAIELYGRLASKDEPQLLYAAALANLKYSNEEIAQIGYDKNGFMEENTIHRANASKLVSNSKRLLTKAIKRGNDEIKQGNNSPNLIYTLFLAELKLGRTKHARSYMQALEKSDRELYYYSLILFGSAIGDYNSVIRLCRPLMTEGKFTFNAYYYMALALFKTGRYAEAQQILVSLKNYVRNENIEALLFETRYQLR